MYKKYTTPPCPHMGCGAVEMAQPTKKTNLQFDWQISKICLTVDFFECNSLNDFGMGSFATFKNRSEVCFSRRFVIIHAFGFSYCTTFSEYVALTDLQKHICFYHHQNRLLKDSLNHGAL